MMAEQVERSVSPTFSGDLGIVLRPDVAAQTRAFELAQHYLAPDAEYVLRPENTPHITLYKAILREVPRATVEALLNRLNEAADEMSLRLGHISSFRDAFVFWDVDTRKGDFPALRQAHESSLSLASFADRAAAERAAAESGLDEELRANLRLFGYSLARTRFQPHITLGYQPGVGRSIAPGTSERWDFTPADVRLCRMGAYGRVEEILL